MEFTTDENNRVYRKLSEDEANIVTLATTLASALRAAGGKPVSFEQRKAATNAAIAAVESVTKHINSCNERFDRVKSRRQAGRGGR